MFWLRITATSNCVDRFGATRPAAWGGGFNRSLQHRGGLLIRRSLVRAQVGEPRIQCLRSARTDGLDCGTRSWRSAFVFSAARVSLQRTPAKEVPAHGGHQEVLFRPIPALRPRLVLQSITITSGSLLRPSTLYVPRHPRMVVPRTRCVQVIESIRRRIDG